MNEKVFFNDSHGHKLCAILSKPKTDTNSIIVMCHGLDSGKDSFINVAISKILVEKKIASFRFDFFSHYESEGNKDERKLDEFIDNTASALEYVKKLGYKNIGLLGSSFGGITSIIVASKTPQIKVLALKATGMGKRSRNLNNYKKDFENKTWIKAGKKLKMPTILVHGTADEDVEFELGQELAHTIQGSKFISIEGANHSFTKKEDFDKMISIISEFIIKNIS